MRSTDITLDDPNQKPIKFSYDLGHELGSGATATVYKGENSSTHKEAAVKRIKIALFDDRDKEKEMKRHADCTKEIKIQKILLHAKNIAQLYAAKNSYDASSKDSQYSFIAMTYAINGKLTDWLTDKIHPLLAIAKRISIAQGIAGGLAEMHARKIIHGDLKPDNILLDDDLNPLICDFGFSVRSNKDDLTVRAVSPSFSPPEHICRYIDGEHPELKPYAETSDVYPYALILWLLLVAAQERPYFWAKAPRDLAIWLLKGNRETMPAMTELSDNVRALLSDLMKLGWSGELELRPTAMRIFETLGMIVMMMKAEAVKAQQAAARTTTLTSSASTATTTTTTTTQAKPSAAPPLTLYHPTNMTEIQFSIDLMNPLGQGNFASVYSGKHCDTQNPVAIKRINSQRAVNYDSRIQHKKNENEIGIMTTLLNGPNLIHILAMRNDKPRSTTQLLRAYIAIEYADNGSLYDWLGTNNYGSLEMKMKLSLMIGIANGLAYMHDQGILHCDLKPGNILLHMVNGMLTALICDFGLSKRIDDSDDLQVTCGTVEFAAPELFHEDGSQSKASDVYSYGVLLWNMTANKKEAYQGLDDGAIITLVCDGKRETIPSDTDPDLSALIEQAWSQDPVNRPPVRHIYDRLFFFKNTREEIKRIEDEVREEAKNRGEKGEIKIFPRRRPTRQ